MSVNTKIHFAGNEKSISKIRDLMPRLKITEVRHIYINTFWITLVFAIALALFLFIKF